MKKVFITIIGGAIITLSSCVKEPVACLQASKTSAETNEAISFTDCSENAHSYLWEFGDGITSTDANPSHTYSSSGTYTVKLTTESKNGKKSDNKSLTVMIEAPVQKFVGGYSVKDKVTEYYQGSYPYTVTKMDTMNLTLLDDNTLNIHKIIRGFALNVSLGYAGSAFTIEKQEVPSEYYSSYYYEITGSGSVNPQDEIEITYEAIEKSKSTDEATGYTYSGTWKGVKLN